MELFIIFYIRKQVINITVIKQATPAPAIERESQKPTYSNKRNDELYRRLTEDEMLLLASTAIRSGIGHIKKMTQCKPDSELVNRLIFITVRCGT